MVAIAAFAGLIGPVGKLWQWEVRVTDLCWSRVLKAGNDNAVIVYIISVAHPPNFSPIRAMPGLARAAAVAAAAAACCTSEHATASFFAPSISI
jgi:hypothetical protein